ncbi:MAG TPA: DUF262 domain-containing protein [Candidatus Ozemobacteraceae bacterium]|nr:DUF262 domain-containing protein [Candidatus Ozemobacteraceae bacterium]
MASQLLKEVLISAKKCDLLLPDFQRDFVWKPPAVIKLICSILNKYPIGGLLFMETEGDYQTRPLDGIPPRDENENQPPIKTLILDGQQRLTSCYKAFFGEMKDARYPGRYFFDYKKYVLSPNVTGSEIEDYIVFRKRNEVQAQLSQTAAEQTAGLFPLDIIFDKPRGTDYTQWLAGFNFSAAGNDPEKYAHLTSITASFQRIIENVTSYQLQFEAIPRATSPEVICTVFETINTTGKRLTVFDLLVARCFPKQIKLREMLIKAVDDPVIRRFDDDEGEELCTIALPRIISLMHKNSAKRGDLLTLEPEVIGQRWDEAVSALRKSLELVWKVFGSIGLRFVPLPDMIPPIAVILSHPKFDQSNPENQNMLKKWYWRCVFSQYFSSSSDTKAARTVKEWTDSNEGWLFESKNIPEVVKNFSLSKYVLSDVARSDNAIYRGVMSLLIANGAEDFGPSRTKIVDLLPGEVDDHHIYPVRFLEPSGIRGNTVNFIANRTPLYKLTNQNIGNDAPCVYLQDANRVSTEVRKMLPSHGIPEIIFKEFTKEQYERFTRDRASTLLEMIKKAVEVNEIDESPTGGSSGN